MRQHGRLLTDKKELKIKEKYLQGKSITELEGIFGIGEKLVRNALRRTKTKKRTKSVAIKLYYKTKAGIKKGQAHSEKIKRYRVNEKFFSRLNNDSAYVLGFWIADGHIEKRNKNLLSFSQKEQDILMQIKEKMNASYKVSPSKNKGYRLSISSKQLCDDIRKMCNFDLTQSKTIVADYPIIPARLDSHFIRGVFDGDGSTWMSKKGQLCISIVGTMKLNLQIQQRLIDNCSVNKTKISDKGVFSELIYTGNLQVKRILDWMYKDASISLKRKKKFYDSI